MNLDPEGERLLSERGLQCFGALTASVTHELNNVLAIIEQTGGLLDDSLAAAKQGVPIAPEKLERISNGIAAQTQRGYDIVKRLNHFAHSTDAGLGVEQDAQLDVAEYDIVEYLRNLLALMQRLVALKKAELSVELPQGGLKVGHPPFPVELMVFTMLKTALAAAEKGDKLRFVCAENAAEVELKLECRKFDPESDVLNTLANALEGGFSVTDSGGGMQMKITFSK